MIGSLVDLDLEDMSCMPFSNLLDMMKWKNMVGFQFQVGKTDIVQNKEREDPLMLIHVLEYVLEDRRPQGLRQVVLHQWKLLV